MGADMKLTLFSSSIKATHGNNGVFLLFPGNNRGASFSIFLNYFSSLVNVYTKKKKKKKAPKW